MVSGHFIQKNNNEDVLILFLDYNYEFSIFRREEHDNIKNNIKNYIKIHKLSFNGKKVLLVISGIVIASFIYVNDNIYLDSLNNEKISYIDSSVISEVVDPSILDLEKNKNNKESKDTIKKEDKQSNTENSSSSNKNSVSLKKPTSTTGSGTSKNNSTNKKTTSGPTTNHKVNTTTESNVSKRTVTIHRQSGKIETLELEEYVVGVVAAEMPASFNIEALKAQAILARTYALKSQKTGKKLTDTVSTQAYIDIDQMKTKWGADFSKYYNKIKQAVSATTGQYIIYQGQIIDAVYHSTSNGYTEDAIEVWGHSVPYLKVVESPWDKSASSFLKTTFQELENILKIFGITDLAEIKIIKKDTSGRVSKVQIGEEIYSGIDIRELLKLRSTDFEFELIDGRVKITTRGYGHGVGLSQYGANGMAQAGYNYDKILKHYYEGINITKL